METIILKLILSSSLLLGFYYFFLAKERMFRFNRIFLITSLIFSYSVPFISIPILSKTAERPNLIFGEPIREFQQLGVNTTENFEWSNIILSIYLIISAVLLLKFIYSFLSIMFLKGERMIYQNHKIVVLRQEYAPFSFLKTMYFGKNYFVESKIDERIFLHEKCHVTQNHTLDIILVEFLRIFSWFNPALFFYRNAMITNHEYLADEFVLKDKYDINTYQHLILHEITSTRSLKLTHQFDFNNTKKRFIMMTTKDSRFSLRKKIAVIPLLAVLFVFFSKGVQAQTEVPTAKVNSSTAPEKHDTAVAIDENNATPAEKELLQAFEKVRSERILKNDTIKKKNNVNAETPVAPKAVDNVSKEFSGILPQFPGGLNAFRSLINSNFDTSVFKGNEGTVKTTLFIEIDENGKMGTVSAEGTNDIFSKEAIRSVSVVKDRVWTPATEDGSPVKYIFKMPLTMSFL